MSTTAVQPKENKMGTMPINKLLLNMSLPMMIAMLIQALYNIIDSMFVAQISENALSAVSLAFPMQNFMIAVGTGRALVSMRCFPRVWAQSVSKLQTKQQMLVCFWYS